VFVIRNEFAMVQVDQDDSAKGTRLMIQDVQTGDCIYLDSLELEALTRLRHKDFAPLVDPSLEDIDEDDDVDIDWEV
jgi:hypothetical protein